LNVRRVAAEASDLLQRAHGRAGRSQQGSDSGESLHVIAGLTKPLIRLGEFIRDGGFLPGTSTAFIKLAVVDHPSLVGTTDLGSRRPN
jgi:hypothetical protein